MIILQTLLDTAVSESIEKDILECALVFQDWRKRLLFFEAAGDTTSHFIEPSWDAQPFSKYQTLRDYAISAQEWNLNSVIALDDSQDWGLLFVPTDYINLMKSIMMYLEDRANNDLFYTVRHEIANFLNKKFIDNTDNYLHITKDKIDSMIYMLAYLSDNQDSEIELSYILHTLIYDYVFFKLYPTIHELKNDYLHRNSGPQVELSYCIKLSINDCRCSRPPVYIPAYNVRESLPLKSSSYLKHLIDKFVNGLELNENISAARKRPLDLLNEHDTIVKASFKYCTNSLHKVIDLMAKIPVIRPGGEIGTDIIPAAYCYGCNEYYILIDDYKKLHGIPLCRVYHTTSIERAYFSTQKFLSNQYQSIVFAFGYNVNANNNLTAHQRKTILHEIISRGILSRVEVISHIKFLIAINKNKPPFHSAILKWQNDKQYLEDTADEQTSFVVNEIHKHSVVRN